MKIKLKVPLGISEKGRFPMQLNSFFPNLAKVKESDHVFVLCDGVSGHAHSEVASALVAQSLGEWMNANVDFSQQLTGVTVRRAVVNAQEHLDTTYNRYEPSRYPMGTTMAMLVVGDFGVAAAHIGNTRIYHLRPSRREVLYRSRDHSLVNDLFVAGRISRAEAEASSKKNVLTRAMLPSPSNVAVPDVAFITDVKAGDYFILCCDGITSALSDKKLKDVLCNSQLSNAQKLASLKMLTDDVAANHSILLIEVERVDKEDSDHLLVDTERLMCDKMVRRSVILAPKPAAATPPPALVTPPPFTPPQESVDTEEIDGNAQYDEAPPQELVSVAPDSAETQPAIVPPPAPSLPKDDTKKSSKRILWMILAALLLMCAIAALMLYNTKRNNDKEISEKSKTEEKSDPDVIVSKDIPNDVVPEDPLEPFDGENSGGEMATGSNVSVTPAPRVSEVPLPSKNRYDTGSNVPVPRVKEGDPYPDAFDDPPQYKDLEKQVPQTPDVSEAPKPQQPQQPQQPGSVPPPKKKASYDPTNPNRNGAVPPPPSRVHNTTAP